MSTFINITFIFSVALLLNACSAKEINQGVDSITSDISNAFEGSKDKTAD